MRGRGQAAQDTQKRKGREKEGGRIKGPKEEDGGREEKKRRGELSAVPPTLRNLEKILRKKIGKDKIRKIEKSSTKHNAVFKYA